MEAVILAGGLGTRMRDILPDLPKPMAPVNGKPFLFHLLSWLTEYKISRIILSIGYKSESIVEYFGKSFCGIPVEYAVEQIPLGTGGAVRYAMEKTSGSDFLVLNGDTYFPVNIDELFSLHKEKKANFTIALKHMKNFSRYGNVVCRDENIIRFNEKKFCQEGLINGGIYIIRKEFLSSMKFPEVFSLETEILEKNTADSNIKGLIFDAPFIDIGIPEDYKRAGSILKGTDH